jgi:AraC-like DNA-binding protein
MPCLGRDLRCASICSLPLIFTPMFFLVGITISAFLSALLLLKRPKSHADLILTAWMVLMTAHQMISYLHYAGITRDYPHVLGIIMPWPLLHGPFLFLYVTAMTREKPLKWMEALPHFIPFVILYLLAIPFYTLSDAEKMEVFDNNGAGYEWYNLIQQGTIVILGLGYIFWSLIRIHRHRTKIRQWFSNTDKITLRWLEYLSIGLGIIWLLVLFFDDYIVFSGVVLLVIFIGMFGITQLPVFYSHREILETTKHPDPPSFDEFIPPTEEAEVVRYAKSGLKEPEATDLHQRLTKLMDEEALYKQNDITLADLAALLDTHPNYLSQVINEKEEKNFYNYINILRVQAFIQASSQPDKKHYSLLALAFESGFNSKSTFNKYFKAHTGKSPSEYVAH